MLEALAEWRRGESDGGCGEEQSGAKEGSMYTWAPTGSITRNSQLAAVRIDQATIAASGNLEKHFPATNMVLDNIELQIQIYGVSNIDLHNYY